MNMKAHALLTGHYSDPSRLPPELRERLPAQLHGRCRVYPRELGPTVLEELAARFRDALRPLHDTGRLGVVLFQFPVWFPYSHENCRELARLRRRFAPYRVAVEFRNKTWMSERNCEATLTCLADHRLTYTCVDEPQGFPSSVPPLAAATTDVALVRFHGRNAARWSRGASSAAARFEYLYTPDELSEWVPKMHDLAHHASEVHVLFNNCYGDYAVRNAQQMLELLRDAGAPSLLQQPRA
jgi:uncharacterized protein YecE (DUF72 family)